MEDEDTHLCLVCQETIMGLDAYVAHKKSGCQRKPFSVHPNPLLSQQSSHQPESSGYSFQLQDGEFGAHDTPYPAPPPPHSSEDHAYNSSQSHPSHNDSHLNLEVTAPLARFIDSAFSPSSHSSVDPNSVFSETGSSQSRPDFFQSLELERKGRDKESGGRTLRSRKRSLPESLQVDLPITMILSNLEFSSDDETGIEAFPSDGSDLEGSDSEWPQPKPPLSHTGGKWKPGERPAERYNPYRPTGGKWKPGQNKKSPSKNTRAYYCNVCKITLLDRFAYNTHLASAEHKKVEALEKSGKSCKVIAEDNQPFPSLVLDASTGEMELQKIPQSQNELVPLPASIVKRGANNLALCEVCDLYFDTIKVYDLHCETVQHKENLMKKLNEPEPGDLEADDSQSTLDQAAAEDLEEHEERPQDKQEKETSHYCVVCKKTFARKYELACHLLTAFHGRRAMKHPKAFEMLNKYSKYVTRLLPFQCNICRFYFTRPTDMMDHLQSEDHLNNCDDLVGPLMCVTCKFKTSSSDQILEHIRSQSHQQKVKSHKVCILREHHSRITCKYCGVQMRSAVRMKRHIEYRHPNRKLKEEAGMKTKTAPFLPCPECDKTFPSPHVFKVHYAEKHADSGKPHKCVPCNKSFASQRLLASHKRSKKHGDYVDGKKGTAVKASSTGLEQEIQITQDNVKKEIKDENKEDLNGSPRSNKKAKHDVKQRPKRNLKRPLRYFERDQNDSDSSATDVNNDEDSVTQAVETVLALEKDDKLGGESLSKLPELPELPEVAMEANCNLEEVVMGVMELDSEDEADHSQHIDLQIHDPADQAVLVKEEPVQDPELLQAEAVKRSRSKAKKLNIFYCKFCDFPGGDSEELLDHIRASHPEEAQVCEVCELTFMSLQAYRIHCAGRGHQKKLSESSLKMELFECPHCPKKYSDEMSQKLHVEYVHLHVSTEEGVARMCQGRDIVTQLYGEHLKKIEKTSFRTQAACPECGKFFMKNNLIEHLRSHTKEKPFKCRHCSKTFTAPTTLRRHLMDHIGHPKKTCAQCGKSFKKQSLYYEHLRIHRNKDKGVEFKCPVCGSVFYLESMLTNHMKRHGERKYKCPVVGCHWSFVLKNELAEHIYTHSREKKFLCDICGHEEGTKIRMRRHVKSHQPVKMLSCEYCPYKTSSKHHLKRHMRIHIGSKPFKCLYCDYTCNTAENIRKHILQTRKHKGMSLYPCKFCEYESNLANDFKQHLHQFHKEYIQKRANEALVLFTGLYRPEEDVNQPAEGSEIQQVMKGRFVKIYDGTRLGSKGEAVAEPQSKRKSKQVRRKHTEGKKEKKSLGKTNPPAETSQESKDLGDDMTAMSLVSLQQPETREQTLEQQQPQPDPGSGSVTVLEPRVYPQGLPWQYVTPDRLPPETTWIPQTQGVDMVLPHLQQAGTTFISPQPPATVLPGLVTTINMPAGTTYHQLEPGTYQVLSAVTADGTPQTLTNFRIVHPQ